MGPKCSICKRPIHPQNEATRQLFGSGRYDNATGLLCADCHAEQRRQYPVGPDWYDRQAERNLARRSQVGRRSL